MSNDITELRAHLFDTLRGLRDKEKPMDLDRAKTVAAVAGVLIDSARVEVEMIRVTGAASGTGFIAVENGESGTPVQATSSTLATLPVRRHRLEG